MDVDTFLSQLTDNDITFFTGVPDSLLGAFCDELMRSHGTNGEHHVVAHNEGGCVALAGGYHLATGKVPCVYMQNSGIGNALNPIASLTHPAVYGIPVLYVIGWRGEPSVPDEPQHAFQGEITLKLLDDLEIEYFIIDKDTTHEQLSDVFLRFIELFTMGKSAAFVVRKGALIGSSKAYYNNFALNRELAIGFTLDACGDDLVVATTGKISREIFELRENRADSHERDFLTVGSMGHSVMIALGLALQLPERRIWCFDGDGSLLMHMGSLGVVGKHSPKQFVHILFNNVAHESVGGVPTVADSVDFTAAALVCGYAHAHKVRDEQSLMLALEQSKRATGAVFIEVPVALVSRSDLMRPTTSPSEGKRSFMEHIKLLRNAEYGVPTANS